MRGRETRGTRGTRGTMGMMCKMGGGHDLDQGGQLGQMKCQISMQATRLEGRASAAAAHERRLCICTRRAWGGQRRQRQRSRIAAARAASLARESRG
jgi:hypothetical protein